MSDLLNVNKGFSDIDGSDQTSNLVNACITFSVVLCVNRYQPWLSEAIESILSQDDADFEFLIAANACTDELWNMLSALRLRDSRIRLFRSDVGQLAFNLNLLADKAHGAYLVRMDADDVSEPNRLGTLRLALAQDPVDVLGSAVILIDAAGREIGTMKLPETPAAIRRAMLMRTAFCHPAVALRRQFLLNMRGYLGGFVSEDTDLWLRALRAGASMRNLPDALLRYRIHDNQSISSRQGYAEVASHWLRELLITPSWYTVRGFIIALTKSLFAPTLPGARRYRSSKVESQ